MIDERRQSWLTYVNLIAGLMNLKDWTILISDEPPNKKEHNAEMFAPFGRKIGTISLSNYFLEDSPEKQRETVVHELLHLHFEPMDHLLWGFLSFKKATAVRLMMEYGVDSSANFIARLMPLP